MSSPSPRARALIAPTLVALAAAACGDSFSSGDLASNAGVSTTIATSGAGGAASTSPAGGAGGASTGSSAAGGAATSAGGAGGTTSAGGAGGAGGASTTSAGGAGGAAPVGCALHPTATLCEDFDAASGPTTVAGWSVGSADQLLLVASALSPPNALRAKVPAAGGQSWLHHPVALPPSTSRVRVGVALRVLSTPAPGARATFLRLRTGVGEADPAFELRLVGTGIELAAVGGAFASVPVVAFVPAGSYHAVALELAEDGLVQATYGGAAHTLQLLSPNALGGATVLVDVGLPVAPAPGQDVEVHLDDLTVYASK